MRILSFMLVVVLLVAAYTGYGFYAWRHPLNGAAQTIIIPPHTGARGAVALLSGQGLVPPLGVMALPLLLSGDLEKMKAGEYEFAANTAPADIIAKIARGEIVIHKITIPEGWNSYQVRDALLKEPLLTGTLPQLPEGSLLPDTLRFDRGEARSAVVARMQKAQGELMQKLWPTHDTASPITTPQQALILASLVEKETGVDAERGQVAGVFVNRLRLGMMLQTDPSVAYGIEVAQGGATLGRALTRNDLLADTAYNTYTRVGLPPTPICNPGKAAIEAALHPAATDALYFVATGTGGHHFAATLAEHEKNVEAYRAVVKAATQPRANATTSSSNPNSRN